jgi:superfamily II DNA/RNA helicase
VTKSFRDLGVAEPLCDALELQQITHSFPIQELTLPLALAGNDVIGQARTGTGKTLAFGLPLLQRIDPHRPVTQALVVVPTRELCLQVYNDLKIGDRLGLRSVSVYGGVGYDEQLDALAGGAHVVVGTPGRLLDHLQRGTLDLSHVTELVLDEADEMLDMGFLPDVERLVEACKAEGRHTMLFSATMPTAIVKLARRYMDQPTFTRAESAEVGTAPEVEQYFLQVHRMDKPRVLARILQAPDRQAVYVFVRTKHMADRLVNDLEELATPAIAIHGDLRQATREKNLDRFRSGKANVLVATEVAARGLDVDNVTHVVNYDCPDDDKMYLHRIGRTARAGNAGVAITFAEFNETERLNVIRKAVGAERDVVPVFSTSPELASWFDLPDATPWEHLGARGSGSNGNGSSSRRSARSNASPQRGEKTDGDTSPRRGGKTDGGASSRRGDKARDEATPRRSSAGSRNRTDEQRESASGSDGAPPADRTRRDADTEARARTRTRTRGRASDGAAHRADERSRPSEVDGRRGSTSSGARSDRSGRSSDRGGRSRATSSGGESSAGARGDVRARAKGQASTTERAGTGRSGSSRAKGASRDRGRGRAERGGRSDAERTAEPTSGITEPLAERGEPARGSGRPQRARRVNVEHLP